MDASMLRSLVTFESAPERPRRAEGQQQQPIPSSSTEGSPQSPQSPPPLAAPAKAVARVYPAVPQHSDAIELEQYQRPAPKRNPSSGTVAFFSPVSPGGSIRNGSIVNGGGGGGGGGGATPDLEMSRPSSPTPGDDNDEPATAEALQSLWEPYKNRFRLASASLLNMGNGLNDSAPGALIPYIEKHHSIGYAVVSLIFVGNALGFITGAFLLDALRARLGRARTLALAQTMIALAYVPIVASPLTPFGVVVACFFFIGLGTSINLSVANTFCGSLSQSTSALGIMHGSYGMGGIIGPLIATSVVTSAGADAATGHKADVWSRYYFLPMGFAVFNAIFALWSFGGYEAELGPTHPLVSPRPEPTLATTAVRKSRRATFVSKITMEGALKSRIVLLGALFIFAYNGAEVSISGWVISFLITARGGDPASVGYVTAGFWAGITVGRLLISGPAGRRFGERRVVYVLILGSAIFEALVWSVPDVVGDAVAVSIVGLLLGPVYPCSAAVFMRTMSRSEQLSGMGVISAFGSSGGAAAPFTTGLLAQVAGTFVLHPVAITLFGVMAVCWWAQPKERKRTE